MHTKTISLILTCLFTCYAAATEDDSVQKLLAPKQAARAWNDALLDGNLETAARLTSATSREYVTKNFGSLKALSERYRSGGLANMVVDDIHEEISGESAIVIYRVKYESGAVKYWMDKLLLEDGIWKLAPQHVKSISLK